jgi:hypothetical protein
LQKWSQTNHSIDSHKTTIENVENTQNTIENIENPQTNGEDQWSFSLMLQTSMGGFGGYNGNLHCGYIEMLK